MTPFTSFDSFFNILILVTVISLIAWRLKFPPTIAFIVGGIVSTVSINLDLPILSPDMFVSILLPPILFQEALHLEIDGLMDEADSVLAFAVLGTIIMCLTVALAVWWLLGFSPLEALIFGILIAPTDPVSVIRVFHDLGVNRSFRIIISGESLFNDGIAIVIYSTLISIVMLGTITISEIGQLFLITIAGGVIIGVISGYLIHMIFSWTTDKFAEVLVSFIAAFGVFRFAEGLHASGVIAIVVSGLIINYRTRTYGGFSEDSFEMMEALWEFIGYLASSIAFIFIGTNLDQQVFFSNIVESILLLTLLLSLRFLMVEGVCFLLVKIRGKRFLNNWRNGFAWSGLRGAISIVLVLGTAGLVEHSDLMIALTFGIVVLSNIVQGLTIGGIIHSQNLAIGEPNLDREATLLRFNERYNPEGYRFDISLFEKILYNAPEFFINETYFGIWLSRTIISLLNLMNKYLIGTMFQATKGIKVFFFKGIVNILSQILNIVNRNILRRGVTEDNKK
jgi:CPA1 family monovalent cation:H+ antiporter